jgi:hypothetical protein
MAHCYHAGVPTSRLEPPMDSTKSRTGMLVGLAAAAGAFGVAAMMSAATAPTARADDFTEILNDVEGVLGYGQAAFGDASTDFGGGEVPDGLAALVNGVDDDLVGAPDDLYVGTVDALTNEPVSLPVSYFAASPVADFSDAVSGAQYFFGVGEGDFTEAASALSSGDFADAAFFGADGSIFAFVVPADDLLLGAAAALGF